MKRIYSVMQTWQGVVVAAVVYGSTIPLQNMFGYSYLIMSTIAASITGLLVLWYLIARWDVPRPGCLVAVGASSLGGVIFGFSTMAAYGGLVTKMQWELYFLFAFFALTTGNGVGLLWHFCVTKRQEIMNKPE